MVVHELVFQSCFKRQLVSFRPYGKKTVQDPQRPTNLLQPSDTNVVSSASSNYVIPEGDKTRKIITHQYQKTEPGGLKSNTYIKQELVSSQPYQQVTVNQVQSQQTPKQVYVDIQDQYKALKENLSPLPTDFLPKSASSPVPHFRVRNVKDVLTHPPTEKVYPVQSPAAEPQMYREDDANIPMFRVSKFQPRISDHEQHVKFEPEPVVYLEPEPIPQDEEYQPLEADVTEAPPPHAPDSNTRNIRNEPMMFPVPRPTFDAVKELISYRRKDENEDEVDHEYYDVHGNRHLPIFAPPVEIEPDPEGEDRNIMDSGYDESMMTPGSGSRPPNLPDLDLTRTYSLESDVPGTPDTGSTATRRRSKTFFSIYLVFCCQNFRSFYSVSQQKEIKIARDQIVYYNSKYHIYQQILR
jgi:hypothetical protein